jgi:hypothetical protein
MLKPSPIEGGFKGVKGKALSASPDFSKGACFGGAGALGGALSG